MPKSCIWFGLGVWFRAWGWYLLQRRFVYFYKCLLTMKYRKSPWSREQNPDSQQLLSLPPLHPSPVCLHNHYLPYCITTGSVFLTTHYGVRLSHTFFLIFSPWILKSFLLCISASTGWVESILSHLWLEYFSRVRRCGFEVNQAGEGF